MDDYISREAASDLMAMALSDDWEPEYAQDRLSEIPAADVRPVVRGKWIKYAPHNSDMMTCSECEKYWILDGDQYEFNFCPNCGADMRPEEAPYES